MSASLYLCLHVRDFAAQALTRVPQPEDPVRTRRAPRSEDDVRTHQRSSSELASSAVAVLAGEPPLEFVFAINQRARALGLQLGMTRTQVESFGVSVLRRDREQEDAAFAELMRVAEKFSPRVEAIASPQPETCGATLVLDVSGSERLLGDAQQIANSMQKAVRECGFEASVVAAHNAYAAVLVARGTNGASAIAHGGEVATLAPLPLSVLELDEEVAETFATWGIRTLGQLVALPTKELIARVGERGFQLQSLARGNYSHLLVPEEEPADAALCESLELEHPVDLLEPLLFLLGRMLEQVTERANERALAIASVETRLTLASSAEDGTRTEMRRTVRPALPERNHLTLLKLVQLDLELHPPEAAVMALHITAHPARAQSVQHGLFAAQTPEAGRLEVLLARLRKLVGEERVGAAELLDTHAPEAFRVNEYDVSDVAVTHLGDSPKDVRSEPGTSVPGKVAERKESVRTTPSVANCLPRESAVRMLRPPHAVHAEMRGDAPVTLYYEGQRLRVETSSGPWRTDGAWWTHPAWSREEWDVVLDEQSQRCLRLAFDPGAHCWYVIGVYD
jgi:protein ImuB